MENKFPTLPQHCCYCNNARLILLILLLALNWQARQMWIQTCKMPLASCSDFQPFTNLASMASVYTLCKFCLQSRSDFHPFTNFASRASGYPNLKNQIFAPLFLPLVGDNPKPHKLKYFLQNYFKRRFSEDYVFTKTKISVLSKEQLFDLLKL